MKFLMLIKLAESYRSQSIPQGLMDAMGEFVSAHMKSGVLADTAGLKPTADGFRIRLSRGQLGTTDGPFTETKEVIGGYAIVDVPSRLIDQFIPTTDETATRGSRRLSLDLSPPGQSPTQAAQGHIHRRVATQHRVPGAQPGS